MQKSRLMLEIERKIGENIENYLSRICKNGWKSANIGKELGIHKATLCRWVVKLGLEKENKIPSREELNYFYNVIRKPVREAAREIGVDKRTYYRWLENAGIERRHDSEAYLPSGFSVPCKEDLVRHLSEKTNSETAAIYGVNPHTLRTWKQKAGLYKFRKSRYGDLSLRTQLLSILVNDSGKEIEELKYEDFKNVRQANGKTYRSLLNWYLSRNAHLFSIAKIEFIKDYKINGEKSISKLSLESS